MELIDKLLLLKEACKMCGKTEYADVIENYIKTVDETVRIMIVGEGKSGKTTLLNGLLGRKVAKDGYAAKTANQNFFRNISGKEYVSLNSFQETGTEITDDEHQQQLYEQFQKQKDANAYWSLHLKWPAQGITVIDIEGFHQVNMHYEQGENSISVIDGLNAEYKDLFDKIYPEADIVVWCVKGTDINITKKKYRMVAAYNKPIFLVYTCADEDLEDEEDLVEIETINDLKIDMQYRLQDIAQECIADFAGFAGDCKNPERRQYFLEELRNSINTYMKNCNGGVKKEVGERLFQGIYIQLLKEFHEQNSKDYEILQMYVSGKEKLRGRLENILDEPFTRICELLDAINMSIDHKNIYSSLYQKCNYDRNETFEEIKKIYNHLFEQKTELYELIDHIIPEKVKLIQDEFFIYTDIIIDQSDITVDFSSLWTLHSKEFFKLKNDSRGWLTAWKPEVFQNYFSKLKKLWENIIKKELFEIEKRYKIGFMEYLRQNNGLSLKKYVNSVLQRESMEQMLLSIKNTGEFENQEYHVYGFQPFCKLIGIYGEHNLLYQNLSKEISFGVELEEILMYTYIEREFNQYERQLEIHFLFDEYGEIEAEDCLQAANGKVFSDLFVIPECFDGLSIFRENRIYIEKAVNIDKKRIQKFYQKRKHMLEKLYDSKKKRYINTAMITLRKEVNDWLMSGIVLNLEAEFEKWEKNFWKYLEYYQKTYTFKKQTYYGFIDYLKQNNPLFYQLYNCCSYENVVTLIEQFRRDEESFSDNKKKIIMSELELQISDFKKRENEVKQQQLLEISKVNKEILLKEIDGYLQNAHRIAIKISVLDLISVERYDDCADIQRKIRNISNKVSDDEKKFLTRSYRDVENELFGEICNLKIYSEVKKDLRTYFDTQIRILLLSINER